MMEMLPGLLWSASNGHLKESHQSIYRTNHQMYVSRPETVMAWASLRLDKEDIEKLNDPLQSRAEKMALEFVRGSMAPMEISLRLRPPG